jgi:hypothetical protein
MSNEERELTPLDVRDLKNSLKHLAGSLKYKSKFDLTDILVNHNFPTFTCEADKFECALEVGELIRKIGITGIEQNLADFFELVGLPHYIALLKRQSFLTIEQILRRPEFKQFIKGTWEAIK